MRFLDQPEWRLAVALAIGLLVGAEREQSKGTDSSRKFAGVRTFALASLLGNILTYLDSPYPFLVGLAVIGGLAIVAHVVSERSDPGITTELALITTFALGALAQKEPLLALGTGVTASLLLAIREPLHRVVREVVTGQELVDALTFAVAALVVLPLVPNHAIDPWGVINPFVLWRLAIIVMAITGFGYLLLRWVGPRFGLAIAGFASGFVSSVVTINTLGSRAREDSQITKVAVAGAAASTIATFIQLGIVIATVNPALAFPALPALVCGGLASVAFGLMAMRRAARSSVSSPQRGRAFRLLSVIAFVAIVAGVTLASVLLQEYLGGAGMFIGAAVGGFVDVHATASAIAAMSLDGTISPDMALTGLLIGITTNTITKAAVALLSGPRSFSIRVIAGLALALAASWAGYLIAVLARQ